MDKYFDTGLVTVGEDKDTGLISSHGNIDIYDIERINEAIGHRIEKLTVVNDGPDQIYAISKIGCRWDRTVLYPGEAKLITNLSELRVKANNGAKYRVTEFTLVTKGDYLE